VSLNDNDNGDDATADRLAAVMAAHEFLLEVLWANNLAWQPAEQAKALVEDLIRVGAKSYAAPSSDPVVIRRMQRMADFTAAAVANLGVKALRRSHEIRERLQAAKR
jgi:hypothetical protein